MIKHFNYIYLFLCLNINDDAVMAERAYKLYNINLSISFFCNKTVMFQENSNGSFTREYVWGLEKIKYYFMMATIVLDQPRTPLLPFLKGLVKVSNDPIFGMAPRIEFTTRSAIAPTNPASLKKIVENFSSSEHFSNCANESNFSL